MPSTGPGTVIKTIQDEKPAPGKFSLLLGADVLKNKITTSDLLEAGVLPGGSSPSWIRFRAAPGPEAAPGGWNSEYSRAFPGEIVESSETLDFVGIPGRSGLQISEITTESARILSTEFRGVLRHPRLGSLISCVRFSQLHDGLYGQGPAAGAL